MKNDICSTLAPKYILKKIKWKLHSELSNLLYSAKIQSLAASELQEFLLKMTSLDSAQDTVKFLGWGPGGCAFKRTSGGLLLHLSLNIRDKTDYPADFIDRLI